MTLLPSRALRGPLLAVAITALGCTPTRNNAAPHGDVSVVVRVGDFRTAYESSGTDYRWRWPFSTPSFIVHVQPGGDFAAGTTLDAIVAAAAEGIRLIRLDTGQRVEGEVRLGWYDWRGMEPEPPLSLSSTVGDTAFSFVPTRELTEGWYVLSVDLAGWRPLLDTLQIEVEGVRGFANGDRVFVRLHVGSLPTWWATDVWCDPRAGSCTVAILPSERIPDWDDTSLEVSIDGVPATCTTASSDRDFGLEGGADSHGAARQGNPAVNHLIHACVSQLILGAGRGI